MKHNPISRIAAAAAFLSLALFSCDDMESHNIPLLDQTKVLVDLAMVEAEAPAPIGSIRIRVTGPDFSVIEKDVPPTGVITLHVRPGINRFEVTAFVRPGFPSPAGSFRGISLMNVSPGATASLQVEMKLDEMRLVIPDYGGGSYAGKLVMIDSISGGNRISRNAADIGLTALYPYDVDFDSRGRIYFANRYADAAGGVYRMDDMNSSLASGTCVPLVSSVSVQSIAIDRSRNMLYYLMSSTPYTVYRLNLSGGLAEPLFDITIRGYGTFNTICVDETSGYIYFNWRYVTGSGTMDVIYCYNPNTEVPGVVISYPSPPYATHDLIVKNGYLYASYTNWSDYGIATPPPGLSKAPYIVRLPLDLQTNITPPVYLSGRPGAADPFLGPREFIAVTNRKLYFIDEVGTDDSTDRIISFDDITGSGWNAYVNTDSFFRLYSTC